MSIMITLTRAQLARQQRAFEEAGRILADSWWENAALYAQGGAEALAEAAWLPGGPSREEIAARYERRVQEATTADGSAA